MLSELKRIAFTGTCDYQGQTSELNCHIWTAQNKDEATIATEPILNNHNSLFASFLD